MTATHPNVAPVEPPKLSSLSIPFGARIGLKSAGKPPTLAYSIIRTQLNKIVQWRMELRTADFIARQLDVSRNTVRKVLDISLSTEAMMHIEKAAAEDYEAKAKGRDPQGDLWAPVEDYIFRDFPGFRETKFFESAMRDIRLGRLARKMGEKPGPKKKRAGKVEPPQGEGKAAQEEAPTPIPPGFGTADNRRHTQEFDEMRRNL